MKGYVYFFKHVGIDGVKIGYTTNETVNNRFKSFQTYSPSGGEILGFIDSDKAHELEQKIHKDYKTLRMNGEFFNINIMTVNSIIDKYSSNSLKKVKREFNQWLANNGNNIESLLMIFDKIKKIELASNKPNTNDIEKRLITYKKVNNIDKLIFNLKEVNQILETDYSIRLIKAGLQIEPSLKVMRYINYKGESSTGRIYTL